MAGDAVSLRDELNAKRRELTEEREPKIFDLPGYGPKLAVKYKVLGHELIKEIRGGVARRAAVGEENAALIGMCRTLAEACVGFYTKKDGKEYIPLEQAEGLGEDPIRWGSEELAALFALDIPDGGLKARDIIEAVLPEPILIEGHHSHVTMWMERAREGDDSDF